MAVSGGRLSYNTLLSITELTMRTTNGTLRSGINFSQTSEVSNHHGHSSFPGTSGPAAGFRTPTPPEGGESHHPPPRESKGNHRDARPRQRPDSQGAAGGSRVRPAEGSPPSAAPPPLPPSLPARPSGAEALVTASLIDTCNEETFPAPRPRAGPGGSSAAAPSRRPGEAAELGPRRRGGRGTAHLPAALGPHAAGSAVPPAGAPALHPDRRRRATYFHLTPPPGLRSSRTSFGRRPPLPRFGSR